MGPNVEVYNNGIWIFRNMLTSDECDELLEYYKDIEKHEATTVGIKQTIPGQDDINTISTYNKKIRKGSIKFARDLYKIPYGERLVMALDSYSADTGITLNDDDVDFQLAIYDNVGDHFTWHADHTPCLGTFDVSQRKISASLQLSDPEEYEGCDLLLKLPLDENGKRPTYYSSRAKGDLIVFPSFAQHCVTKLESGIRKSLVLWYMGPAWR